MDNIFLKFQMNKKLSITVAILVATLTLYIVTNYLQKNEHENYQVELIQDKARKLLEIRQRFLEYENICYDLQIFINFDTKKIEKNKSQEIEKSSTGAEIRKEKHDNGNKDFSKTASTATITSSTIKREQNSNKRIISESIIYLFALIFIYLLLKAASDILHHYKMQSKGDKTLRRCSLHSYAQMHKNDRRRSSSKGRTASSTRSSLFTLGTRTRSVDDENPKMARNQESGIIGRRCSTPVTINSIGGNFLTRRTSIAGSFGTLIAEEETKNSETKRRVRMINRH